MDHFEQLKEFVPECFPQDSDNKTLPAKCQYFFEPAPNGSSNVYDHIIDPDTGEKINEPIWMGFVITLYSIVIILGALLNTLVVATVIKTKQMWNATNIFIANLAIADIFVCTFDLPLSLYQALTGSWIFGKPLCHVIPMMFGVVVYASTLTLTMIAVDRFILIIFPMKTRMTVKMAIMLVIAIAIIAMAVASPIAIFSAYEVHFFPTTTRYLCKEQWPGKGKQIYTILTLVAQYFLPLLVILVLYALIFRHLRLRMQKRSSRKTKTTKMLVAVVLVFAVTWTPFHLYAIIMEFPTTYKLVPVPYVRLVDVLLKVFALSSSCINPFLYGWLNDNYRAAFKSIIKRPTKAPLGIQREDSDDMSKTARSTVPNSMTPLKQLYHKINPKTGKVCTPEVTPGHSPVHAKSETTPLQENNHKVNNGCEKPTNGEKQVVVTVENGHCHASVQTPLLPT